MSSYRDHLPAEIWRDSELAQGLLAVLESTFSTVAPDGSDRQSFEDRIKELPRYFRPSGSDGDRTPTDFLMWLSSVLSFPMGAEWDENTRRRLLSEAVPLYRQRGTRSGLQRILLIHLGHGDLAEPDFSEEAHVARFRYDDEARVRVLDTREQLLFEPPPHYFQVIIRTTSTSATQVARDVELARQILDREKPTHTVYGLRIASPTLRLGLPPGHPDRWLLGVENTVL